MKIIFVRHGEAIGDKLTRFGKKQARNVVRDLFYENISKIYSSPLQRAVQTASIIAKKLNIKDVTTDKRISEREQKSETMSKEEIIEFDNNYLKSTFSRKDPEGCKEYLKRIHSFLNDVKKHSKKDSCILIVGHSSMTYAMGAYFIGLKKDKVAWIRIGNCNKICFEC